jgi:hypothetical protein
MIAPDDSQPQITITLRAFGLLEYYLGASRIELDCPAGLTFTQLCEIIHTRWGAQLPPALWEAGARRFTRQVVVMIAGCDLPPGEDPLLAEGQEVCLLLPFAGGSTLPGLFSPSFAGLRDRRRGIHWTISSFNGKNWYSRHSQRR